MARRIAGSNGGPKLDALNLALGDGYDEQHEPHWRRAWERHRDEYMSPEYLAQHPGSRVWAWWQFEAPEDTPEGVGFASTRGDDAGDTSAVEYLHERDVATIAFLHESGLLTDGEREALREKVRDLEAGGYGDFDPHGNMAHALARARTAGVDV